MLEHVQPAIDFVTDPSVQAILTPLIQGVVALSVGWKFLTVAYTALCKAFGAEVQVKAVKDAFAASLMDALNGECVLDTFKTRDAKSNVIECGAILADNVLFVAHDDNIGAEALIDGRDELPAVKSKGDRKLIAKKIHEVYDRLFKEAEDNRRYDLACKVMGVDAEPDVGGCPGRGCACSACPTKEATRATFDLPRMGEGSREPKSEPKRILGSNGVPILDNTPENLKSVAWTKHGRKPLVN